MNTISQKYQLLIDAGLFSGFLLAFWLDLTGLALHQWLGVALAATALVHLLLHQKWVAAVSERFFGRTSAQARRFYVVDALLMAGFFLISATGLLISSWLDLPLNDAGILREVHVWSSITTAGLVVLKIGLHSRWIIQAARRIFPPAPAPAPANLPAPAYVPAVSSRPAIADRRSFLKLMGVTAAATLIAVSRAMPGEESALAGDSQLASENASPQVYQQAGATSSTAASSCSVQCDRRCSYPGHCRRYTDSNGNGGCDLGECM